MGLRQAFRERYLDVLASIYLYNEHRGYTSLDRVLEAVRERCPDDHAFQAETARHRAGEHKHYVMFRRWFERQGRATARWNERAADWCIHKVLMLGKLPALFLDFGRARMAQWPDAGEAHPPSSSS